MAVAEHPAHVGGRRRHDHLEAGDVGVGRLDRLRVVERAVHAAAPRRPHHERHREVAVASGSGCGPPPTTSWSKPEWMKSANWISAIGPQAGQGQADADPDDRALGQRRVEHARLAELRGQAVGGPEHAAARARRPRRGSPPGRRRRGAAAASTGSVSTMLRSVPPSGIGIATGAVVGSLAPSGAPGVGRSGSANTLRVRGRRARAPADASADLAAASTSSFTSASIRSSSASDEEPLLDQVLGDAAQRVLLAPGLHLLRRAVGAVVVVGGVGEVAVGLALDQGGAVAAPGVAHGRVHRGVHVERVVAVDDHAAEAVGVGAVGDVVDRRLRRSSARRWRSRCSRRRTPSGAGGCRRS